VTLTSQGPILTLLLPATPTASTPCPATTPLPQQLSPVRAQAGAAAPITCRAGAHKMRAQARALMRARQGKGKVCAHTMVRQAPHTWHQQHQQQRRAQPSSMANGLGGVERYALPQRLTTNHQPPMEPWSHGASNTAPPACAALAAQAHSHSTAQANCLV
jgi:hypothetical protein